jgi:hypothetical protein
MKAFTTGLCWKGLEYVHRIRKFMSEFDLEVGGVGVGCELPLEELWVRTVGRCDASYVAEGCIIGAVGLSPRTVREISTRLYSGEKESTL